uniref:SMP-30/gluconolactonase/LRE family protein n=1 Tax=Flavobacterium sp. TaxID=239 RepID=UPI00404A8F30
MKKSIYILIGIAFIACQNKTEKTEETEHKKEEVAIYQADLELEIKAQLGEGAFWNHETQTLYWIDITGNELNIYNPNTKKNQILPTPSSIGTVVPTDIKSKALVALEDGVYLMNIENGAVERFSNVEQNKPENRFNDGKCDPAGRFWVGSMAFSQESKLASLYRIDAQGKATTQIDSVTISNGIVWTQDKKTMYYIDTPTLTIKAYDYDNNSGDISNERIAVKVADSLGFPDGMAIDANDKLWVGMWNGNAVLQFDPITGKLLSKVNVPAHNVTSCAFGGENLDILYITTASLDMTPEEQKQFPLAGSVFKVKTTAKGVKSSFFKTQE